MNSIVPKTADANSKIAPWYGHYTLSQQRNMMINNLASHLAPLGLKEKFTSIFHTPPYQGYRNNNKFTFGYGLEALDLPNDHVSLQQHIKLGFIGDKYPTSYILPHDKAITINDDFKRICHIVEQVIKESKLKPFLAPPKTKKKKKSPIVQPKHQGVWHSLKVRHSLSQDRYMVLLVSFTRHLTPTSQKDYQATIQKVSELLQKEKKVDLFFLQEYHVTLEPQPYDPTRLIFDRTPTQKGLLTESIMGYSFQISPTSFFQVNTQAATLLYQNIYQLCQDIIKKQSSHKPNMLLDLYCGTGSIGICLSPLFDQIIGIDEVDSSISNAEQNSLLNHITKTRYIVGKCEQSLAIIQNLLGDRPYNLYIVVNPARDGLHKKVIKFIKQANPIALIYSSCNVQTWIRDIEKLTTSDSKTHSLPTFSLESAAIFDLFPHTPHYEVLSALSTTSPPTSKSS